MLLYKKMYHHLFNAVTDALRELDAKDVVGASQILMEAQLWCGEEYINTDKKKPGQRTGKTQ